MSVQQTIDATVIDQVPYSLFKGLMDLDCRRSLALGRTSHERLEEGTFLFQREVLVTSPTFPRGLDGSYSPSVVGGNHPVDG